MALDKPKFVFEGAEVFLAPTKDQLDELEERYGIDKAREGDILRLMGPWGLMLVLRPTQGSAETCES